MADDCCPYGPNGHLLIDGEQKPSAGPMTLAGWSTQGFGCLILTPKAPKTGFPSPTVTPSASLQSPQLARGLRGLILPKACTKPGFPRQCHHSLALLWLMGLVPWPGGTPGKPRMILQLTQCYLHPAPRVITHDLAPRRRSPRSTDSPLLFGTPQK